MSIHPFTQSLYLLLLLLLQVAKCRTQLQENVCIKTLHDLQRSVFGSPSAGDTNHENLLSAFFPPNKFPSFIVEVFYHVNASWATNSTTKVQFTNVSTSTETIYKFRWSWSPVILFLEPFQAETLSLYTIILNTEVAHITVDPFCENGNHAKHLLNHFTTLVSVVFSCLIHINRINPLLTIRNS